ncbi:MAG: tRNA (adenosine(37)-N6)-threonylcarbamoyltransferase complex ATPase subunit type 1 TsaE [Planctomycetota bacterium]
MSGRVPVAMLSYSEVHTRRIGEALGQLWATTGDPLLVLSLGGELGAGKTHFSKGVVRGLGGDDAEVVSPTFTLMAVYPTPIGEVHHFDCYRLADAADAADVGLEESLSAPPRGQRRVVLIEWGSRVPELVPGAGDNVRRIELGHGIEPGGISDETGSDQRRIIARGFTRAERDALLHAGATP